MSKIPLNKECCAYCTFILDSEHCICTHMECTECGQYVLPDMVCDLFERRATGDDDGVGVHAALLPWCEESEEESEEYRESFRVKAEL